MGVNPAAISLWRQLRVDVAGSASSLEPASNGLARSIDDHVAMARNIQQIDQDAAAGFGNMGAAL